MYILDASIAVKWFFEDEAHSEQATKALHHLVEHPDSYFVPELFYLEVAAVLVKKSGGNAKFSSLALEKLYALGIRTIPFGTEAILKSVNLACKLGLSVYDGIYIISAELMGSRWLTSDEKAVRKLPKSRYLLLSQASF